MAIQAEECVYALLAASTAVGALAADRIYPQVAPQQTATLPYMTYNRIDGIHMHNMSGPSGLVNVRMQIDYYASTYSGASALADAARNVLDGYTGSVTVGSTSIDIKQCHLISDNSDFVQPQNAAEVGTRRFSHDYQIVHETTTPN